MSVLVTIYEGEHDHGPPSPFVQANDLHQNGSHSHFVSAVSSDSTITLGLTQGALRSEETDNVSMNLPKELVEQMASSLTKDPNFTAALASAICGRVFQHLQTQNYAH